MSASLAVSCLGDLDTMPLDKTVSTVDKAFESPSSYSQYVNYAYAYFSLVSQGKADETDLAFDDAGQSEFVRQYMVLNEMCTDSFKCIWNDDYVYAMNSARWTSTTSCVMAVYLRALKGISIINQFLDESISGDGAVNGRGHSSVLNTVHQYRAELRVLRAFWYSVLVDLFGNPPLILPEHIGSSTFPAQMSKNFAEGRRLMFEWIENELKESIADNNLPATPVEYPRLSKGAAYAILARLYLNAEVYTGTARWSDAMSAAKTVIEQGGYELCPRYDNLFLQDNSTNGAQKEFIVAAIYDAVTTQSYGGTTHLLYGSINSDMQSVISDALAVKYGKDYSKYDGNVYLNQWNGYHCSDEFIDKNFALSNVAAGAFNYSGDKRALLYYFDNPFQNNSSDITSGYSCLKWVPVDSQGNAVLAELNNDKYSSADFPLCRLAEMYLIYAEADLRLNGSLDATSRDYLLKLGQRANGSSYSLPSVIDLDWILAERVREFMWEGHRRVDLIRYGYFTSANYPWPYKGGIEDGRVAIDSYRTVYPIINTDLIANPNLVQNPGY